MCCSLLFYHCPAAQTPRWWILYSGMIGPRGRAKREKGSPELAFFWHCNVIPCVRLPNTSVDGLAPPAVRPLGHCPGRKHPPGQHHLRAALRLCVTFSASVSLFRRRSLLTWLQAGREETEFIQVLHYATGASRGVFCGVPETSGQLILQNEPWGCRKRERERCGDKREGEREGGRGVVSL